MGGKGRAPCCDKSQVKRGPWSPSEDLRLISFIQKHGHDNWRSLPKQAGLLRCGKSCRLRWINYLRPDLKRGNFTREEENSIIKLHEAWGNRWSKIASQFPGRTDNEIKNVWNTHLRKRVALKNSGRDDQSKELSSITSSSSTTSSSGKRSLGAAVDSEHQSDQESIMTNSAKVQETLDQKSPVEVPNQASVDVAKEYSKALTISSSFSSNGSSSSLSGPDYLMFNFPEPVKEGYEIPFESDDDFWNMLDGFAPNQPNVNEVLFPQVAPNPAYYQSSNLGLVENGKWLTYLESELGIKETAKSPDPIDVQWTVVQDFLMKDAADEQLSVPENCCDKLLMPTETDKVIGPHNSVN